MHFLRKFFKKNITIITCPRCLGKGHVDQDDIKRLKRELIWAPGKCAYCNGTGKAESNVSSKVGVDEAYLTVSLPKQERESIINGNRNALKKMTLFNKNMDLLIQEITDLHSNRKLNAEQIAELYLKSATSLSAEEYIEARNYCINYINTVISTTQR